MVRYQVGPPSSASQPLQSSAVSCAGLCFLSAIYPHDPASGEEVTTAEQEAAEYRRQAEQVGGITCLQLLN
jgi:hypothetical protein